jgi:hypothetical protein
MDRPTSGYLAEAKFEYMATTAGIVLSKPIYNLAPYDYVADKEGRLYKCQIKKAYIDKFRQHICELRRQSTKEAGKKLYQAGDFDFLCVVDGDDIYIIPWDKIAIRRSNIMLGKKYIQYLGNWDFNP